MVMVVIGAMGEYDGNDDDDRNYIILFLVFV
jgi:hypothetical protein